MIPYEFGTWGIGFIFQLRGSVFPKALFWSVPSALLAATVRYHVSRYNLGSHPEASMSGAINLWGTFTGMVGFLLVFRTQIAYSRFWEGGTILQQVRGVWFNATSNLIAFCSSSIEKEGDVAKFQHLLVRLMSLLYCTALQQVASVDDGQFEVLDYSEIDEASLRFLSSARDRCEVVMQWIQRLIVNNIKNEVIPIAPPIASRVFQELSNGIVDVQNAKKIREFPFPFPYAQIITAFLLLNSLFTPIIAALVVESYAVSTTIAFVITFAFWSLNYIAAELELPFGDDPNDLPISMLQENFNESLSLLLNPAVNTPPEYEFADGKLCLNRHKCRLTNLRDASVSLNDSVGVFSAPNFTNAEVQLPKERLSEAALPDGEYHDAPFAGELPVAAANEREPLHSERLVKDVGGESPNIRSAIVELPTLDLPPKQIPQAKVIQLPTTGISCVSVQKPKRYHGCGVEPQNTEPLPHYCRQADLARHVHDSPPYIPVHAIPTLGAMLAHEHSNTADHAFFTPRSLLMQPCTGTPENSKDQSFGCKRKPPESPAGDTPVTPSVDLSFPALHSASEEVTPNSWHALDIPLGERDWTTQQSITQARNTKQTI